MLITIVNAKTTSYSQFQHRKSKTFPIFHSFNHSRRRESSAVRERDGSPIRAGVKRESIFCLKYVVFFFISICKHHFAPYWIVLRYWNFRFVKKKFYLDFFWISYMYRDMTTPESLEITLTWYCENLAPVSLKITELCAKHG